jgi:hypothetical protein
MLNLRETKRSELADESDSVIGQQVVCFGREAGTAEDGRLLPGAEERFVVAHIADHTVV